MKLAFSLLAILSLALIAAVAAAQPIPPCDGSVNSPSPFYGLASKPPVVRIWKNVEVDKRYSCLKSLPGRVPLAVTLAGRFNSSSRLEQIASRVGAISATTGLKYWSTTRQDWRTMITDAFALEGPNIKHRRTDFTAQEILSGQTLYFAQNDTFSTGLNVYHLSANEVMPDRFVVEIVNLTAIQVSFVTLFEPEALRSLHFIDRLNISTWGYYGVSTFRSENVDAYAKSLVNRAGAFYRFLIGEAPTREPPLAP